LKDCERSLCWTVMVDHFGADVPNFPLPDWIHLGATGVRLFSRFERLFHHGPSLRRGPGPDGG